MQLGSFKNLAARQHVLNRGAILVLVLTAAGLVAGGVAVWFQHRQSRRALALWGAAEARRIERAGRVDLLMLAGGGRADSGTSVGPIQASKTIDISHVWGLLHFRRSLLQDANFDWQSTAEEAVSDSDWDYAARFSDDEGSIVVMFDLDRGILANRAAPGRTAVLTDRMSQGLTRFLKEVSAKAERETMQPPGRQDADNQEQAK